MARLTINIPPDLDWQPTDVLELWIGTENAANLAASTPAGGTQVHEQSPWPDDAQRGGWGAPGSAWGGFVWGHGPASEPWGSGEWGYGAWGFGFPGAIEIVYDYVADDPSATLPVGVKVADEHGNASAVVEVVVQLADPPQGVRDLAVESTGVAYQGRLTWTESPDV